MSSRRFTDRVAIVTGASRGIGRGIALALAGEGARVVVNYFEDAEAADGVVAEIIAAGGAAVAHDADVGDRRQVEGLVASTLDAYGQIDVLVNNAGICPFAELPEVSDAIWERTLRTNLYGPFLVSQLVAATMASRGRGAIVNISSVSSYIGSRTQVHYCASKGGVNALTAALAVALGPQGIRVNAVLPGGVHTDINRQFWEGHPERSPGLPVDRVGQPLDIARAVCYLASDDASWVTGALLPVDGGRLVI